MSDDSSATISSSVTLPSSTQSDVYGFKILVAVSTNDDKGAQIAGLEAGDYLGVGAMSGQASFSTVNVKLIKGIINVVNKIAEAGIDLVTDEAAEPAVEAWNRSLKALEDGFDQDKITTKVRDGWGQAGDGGYAIDEGGVLVCLPQAGGPLHQDSFKLDGDASKGRLPKYYPQGKAFFPCNLPGGTLYAEATEAGTAHILAYDSKFEDNQGAYNMELCVLRPSKMPSGLTIQDAIDKILQLPPNTGLADPNDL